MDIPWSSINGFAGVTGIGAICILGFFFILDAEGSSVLPTLNEYASTPTWGILAAVPAIAISYLIGQFAVVLVVMCFDAFAVSHVNEANAILQIGMAKNDFLGQEFSRIKQERDLLSGSSVAFVLLGVGAYFERRNLPQIKRIITLCTWICVVVGIGLFWLGVQRAHVLNELVEAVVNNMEGLIH